MYRGECGRAHLACAGCDWDWHYRHQWGQGWGLGALWEYVNGMGGGVGT